MRPLRTYYAISLASLCVLVSAGCGDDGDLTGPETPEQQFKDVFDVSVNVQSVLASSNETCDGKLLFGGVNPGEFQFLSIIYRGNTELSRQSTPGYNQVLGKSYELGPKQTRSHQHSGSFNGAEAGEELAILFRAAEWDGTSKDSRLDNEWNEVVIPFGPTTTTGSYPISVTVGNDTSCGLTLRATVSIDKRRVAIS